MELALPKLKVKLNRISTGYEGFLSSPEEILKDLLPLLKTLSTELHTACTNLIKNHKEEELQSFVNNLKQFINKNHTETLDIFSESQLSTGVEKLIGFGPKLTEAIKEFGINTVKDMLFAIPFRYEIIEEAHGLYIGRGVLSGEYSGHEIARGKNGKQMFRALFRGGNGFFYGIWLHFNSRFPSSALVKGQLYNLYGIINRHGGSQSIFHPEFIDKDDMGKIRPIYSAPVKVAQKVYYKALQDAIKKYLHYAGETLPEYIRNRYKLPDIHDSLMTLHHPGSQHDSRLIINREHPALKRLIYEEFLYLQLRMFMKKSKYAENKGITFNIDKPLMQSIAQIMPFKLTRSQKLALKEIFIDMKKPSQMNRLLQGDVGSGKTIVSFISALTAVKNGYQAAILAPTEVLAEQHYKNLERFLAKTGYYACLLTGSVKAKDKKQIKEAIKAGDIQFIVGTHAIIQEDVEFHKLGFAVIDEQHRFGVKQRKALMDKGGVPDILLMTATPIPRTLALTCYGDLDLSEITELPPGRIPSITKVYRHSQVKSAVKWIRELLTDGGRAYFIYPAIEETQKNTLKSATENFIEAQKYFPDKLVGLLHGKLKAEEKRDILNKFETGKIDILVSTTVVEVGVDVKEAAVIMIEDADRFGLAQLHQLRGRVGRNDKQSYCILVASENISEAGLKRLHAMEETNSGFELAQTDLELRGQGDFFGIKQSGIPEFQFADIIKDTKILRVARKDALEIITNDKHLNNPENAMIRSVLMQRWKDEYELFLVG